MAGEAEAHMLRVRAEGVDDSEGAEAAMEVKLSRDLEYIAQPVRQQLNTITSVRSAFYIYTL